MGWSGRRGWLRCGEWRQWVYILLLLFCLLVYLLAFICQQGWREAEGELGHLAGSPASGGGIWSCHTLNRVHTVWINNNNNKMSYLWISVHPHCLVNVGDTPASLHHLNVLDEPNQWRLPVSQPELICKWSKRVTQAGGSRGDAEVEQRIDSQ